MSDEIDRARAVLEAMAPGPWVTGENGNEEPQVYGSTVGDWVATLPHQCLESLRQQRQSDATGIALSRNIIGELLDVLEAVEEMEATWPHGVRRFRPGMGEALDRARAAIRRALGDEA